jgi:Type IV secretion system pilin
MKNFLYGLLAAVIVILPTVSFAANGGGTGNGGIAGGQDGEIGTFLGNVLGFIDNVVIPFILAIGFLVFIWGIFKYFILGGANDEAKESGKSLIMYAIGGFVVILAFWGIVNILSNGLGLEDTLDSVPTVKVE